LIQRAGPPERSNPFLRRPYMFVRELERLEVASAVSREGKPLILRRELAGLEPATSCVRSTHLT
jgi:hypothetical protein